MSMRHILKKKVASTHEEHWIPLSDLMTGLMMIFMLIAIVFMLHVESDAKKIKEEAHHTEEQAKVAEDQAKTAKKQADLIKSLASIYDQMRNQLYIDLYLEFKNDLPKWQAVLLRDLTIRFQEPEVLFKTGESVPKPRFLEILNDFFPRYVRVLASEQYRNSLEEIRIVGHTSSIWKDVSEDRAYIENMQLSQARTRAVLEYVLSLSEVAPQKTWLRGLVTANGLSSSKLIFRDNKEDIQASQRVEFKVRTNADERIDTILKAIAP
jgi:outer membrane protein OmpA-like peptidoglycan-associated protein